MLPCSLGGNDPASPKMRTLPVILGSPWPGYPSALGIVIFVIIAEGRVCFVLSVQKRGIPASGFVGGRLADVQCVRVAIPQLEDPRAVHDLVELFGIEFGEQEGGVIGRQVV